MSVNYSLNSLIPNGKKKKKKVGVDLLSSLLLLFLVWDHLKKMRAGSKRKPVSWGFLVFL